MQWSTEVQTNINFLDTDRQCTDWFLGSCLEPTELQSPPAVLVNPVRLRELPLRVSLRWRYLPM
jgi:hypothetical protein